MVSEARFPVSQYAQVGATQRGVGGTIRYDIAQLPLLEGAYSVYVELQGRRDGATYDRLDHAIRFHVVDRRGRSGLIEPGGVFSLVTSEPPLTGWSDQFDSTA